jgi:hypothetical protein
MSKILATAVPVLVFLHWLAAGQVTVTADGYPVAVPVLLIAAVIITALAAVLVALLVWRVRAEDARAAAWRLRKAGAR